MCGDLVHDLIRGVCYMCAETEIQEPIELSYSE